MNISEKYQEYRKIVTQNQNEYMRLKSSILKIINHRQKIPCYWGNWQPFYCEAMPIFMTIEYILVKPLLRKHQGKLVDDLIYDQCDEFRALLKTLNLQYSEMDACFKICAYQKYA